MRQEALSGRDPNVAGCIFTEMASVLTFEAMWVIGVKLECGHFQPIVANDPVLGTKPDEALVVFQHACNRVFGKAVVGGQVVNDEAPPAQTM